MKAWQTSIRAVLYLFLILVAFVVLAFVEVKIRIHQSEPMDHIEVLSDGIEASGKSMPDFLWVGRAWHIRVQSEFPTLLKLDDWTGLIPSGDHTVFSNHDETNTGRFSDSAFWEFPKKVSVERYVQKE